MIIQLGQVYEDRETGFTGKATAHCFNLHSNDMVHLENSQNSRWIESTRLIVVEFRAEQRVRHL